MNYLTTGPISTTKLLSAHFFEIAAGGSSRTLCVVTCRHRINAVAPDVRTQLTEGKTRIQRDDALAQFGAGFALASGAVIEVVNIHLQRDSELFALRSLGGEKVSAEVHVATNQVDRVAMIEQKGLRRKTFCTFIKMFQASTFEL